MELYYNRKQFTRGGCVLWTPTPTTGVNTRRRPNLYDPKGYDRTFGWLARRHPQSVLRPLAPIDVTEQILSREAFECLWDCRWHIRVPKGAFDTLASSETKERIAQNPRGDDQFLIIPGNNWWEPSIIHRFKDDTDPKGYRVYTFWGPSTWKNNYSRKDRVKTEFIRSIDVI